MRDVFQNYKTCFLKKTFSQKPIPMIVSMGYAGKILRDKTLK